MTNVAITPNCEQAVLHVSSFVFTLQSTTDCDIWHGTLAVHWGVTLYFLIQLCYQVCISHGVFVLCYLVLLCTLQYVIHLYFAHSSSSIGRNVILYLFSLLYRLWNAAVKLFSCLAADAAAAHVHATCHPSTSWTENHQMSLSSRQQVAAVGQIAWVWSFGGLTWLLMIRCATSRGVTGCMHVSSSSIISG